MQILCYFEKILLKSVCFFVFLICVNSLFGQQYITGKIVDEFTNVPIPFASIYWIKSQQGAISDSAGDFSLKVSPNPQDTLVVRYVGYENTYRGVSTFKTTSNIVIYLHLAKVHIGPVVKSRFNKGLRWWKNVVTHRNDNNPYQYNTYSFELYNKLELDLNNVNQSSFDKIKLLKPFKFLLNNVDSLSEATPFLPVFLTESISNIYYSNNPSKSREEIKAVQTNGIKNETVLQFVGGISQKISVYENYFSLFGKEFISPISSVGDRFYHYKGADTQVIGGDKFFHLYFTPKKEGENTFSGDCWIHSTTWAIKKISLNVTASSNINFVNRLSIVQEFVLNNDNKWVFFKDLIIADLSPLKKGKLSFIGRKTATYRNVQLNEDFIVEKLAKNKKKEEVIIDEDAKQKNDTFWKKNRHELLTKNEKVVYWMIDTLKQVPMFRRYANTVEFLFDGHKRFGMIEIGPWYKWISGNQMEKVRTRFDIGTTEKFSQQLRLHGYLAYGFKDQRLKGKFDITYKIPKSNGSSISVSYVNDLDNGKIKSSDDDATTDNMFSQIIRRDGIKQKFINIKEVKVAISKSWGNDLTTQISIKRTEFDIFQPLPANRMYSTRNDEIINTQVDFKIEYTPGEKKIVTHRKVRNIKSNLPNVQLKYALGISDFMRSQFQYQKINVSINQTYTLPLWGKVTYTVYGGKIFGKNLPFMLLEVHPGNEIYYYNKNSFNLMNRFEYASDLFYGFNFEHNIEKKLINLIPAFRKTKIRQFYNVKTVWGDLTQINRKFNKIEFGGYNLRSLKGSYYTEVGTGFDNIFKFFRIDAVWRFAPVIKAANGVVLNTTTQNFGLFGSFRLQF